MKLLLHICCAPCFIYPLEKLKEEGYEIAGFFYNPNIHPLREYKKRREALEDFRRTQNCEIIYPEYRSLEFFRAIRVKKKAPERCFLCWTLRLKKTAQFAKEKGFSYFSTTLLVSPYQDQETLQKIGRELQEKEGINFYYQDFRPGFRKAHDLAKAKGIYCQGYCGCIYSEIERCRESEKH